MRKRSGTDSLTLTNQFTYYTTEIEIGTPAQTLEILIDTGSSDLWVMASSNPYCANNTNEILTGEYINCSQPIIFDDSSSSTFSWNDTEFSITYGDSTFASGRWAQDTVKIGTITLESANFAVGEESNATTCVFGVGLIDGESTVTFSSGSNRNAEDTYINIPQQMYLNGDIGANAYSLWLNDIDSDSGSILFGGVDHARYTGTLETVPIVNAYKSEGISTPFQLTVMLTGLQVQDSAGSTGTVYSNVAVAALLDSGTTLTYLPSNVVEAIAATIGATYSDSVGYYVCECDVGTGSAGLKYEFSGATVTVPFSEILFQLTDENGDQATFGNGQTACALGLLGSTQIILGDTFLRSAYVVYDLENLEISLANTIYNATTSSIEAISSSVPSATKAASYSSTSFTTSGAVSTPTNLEFSSAGSSNSLETSALSGSAAAPLETTTGIEKSRAAATLIPHQVVLAVPALAVAIGAGLL
jgi:yapsin 1